MKRLKIRYVDHLLPLPEGLSPEVVQVHIGTSKNKVEMSILRDGFIVADPVVHTIERHGKPLGLFTCSSWHFSLLR